MGASIYVVKNIIFSVDGCFSFCFYQIFKLNEVQFIFSKTKNIFSGRQAFASSQIWLPQV